MNPFSEALNFRKIQDRDISTELGSEIIELFIHSKALCWLSLLSE